MLRLGTAALPKSRNTSCDKNDHKNNLLVSSGGSSESLISGHCFVGIAVLRTRIAGSVGVGELMPLVTRLALRKGFALL